MFKWKYTLEVSCSGGWKPVCKRLNSTTAPPLPPLVLTQVTLNIWRRPRFGQLLNLLVLVFDATNPLEWRRVNTLQKFGRTDLRKIRKYINSWVFPPAGAGALAVFTRMCPSQLLFAFLNKYLFDVHQPSGTVDLCLLFPQGSHDIGDHQTFCFKMPLRCPVTFVYAIKLALLVLRPHSDLGGLHLHAAATN